MGRHVIVIICATLLGLLSLTIPALPASEPEARLDLPEFLVPNLVMRVELHVSGTTARVTDLSLPAVEGLRWRWFPERRRRDDSPAQPVTSYEIRIAVDDIGSLSLPSATVVLDDGRRLRTPPVTASIPPPRAALHEPVYLDGSADPAQALTGEAVHLRWTLLRLLTAGELHFPLPRSLGLTGDARTISGPSLRERGAIRGADGRVYRVTSIDQVVSYARPGAQQSRGTLTLAQRDRYGDLIAQQQVTIEPIAIDISAPPRHGRPPDFTGRIHPVRLEAAVDESAAGSPRLVVIASGRDPQLIPRPQIQHDPSLTLSPVERDGTIGPQARRFVWHIQASRPGPARIGPISLAYYDRHEDRYQTAVAEALLLEVAADSLVADLPAPRARALPPSALGDQAIDAALAQQRPADVLADLLARDAAHHDWRLWHDAALAAAASGADAQALAWLLHARHLAPDHPQMIATLQALDAPEALLQAPSLVPGWLAGPIGVLLMVLTGGAGLIAGLRRQRPVVILCLVLLTGLIAARDYHARSLRNLADLAVLTTPTVTYDGAGRPLAELPAGSVVRRLAETGADGRILVRSEDDRRLRIDIGDLRSPPDVSQP